MYPYVKEFCSRYYLTALIYFITQPNNFPNKHKKYLNAEPICTTIFFNKLIIVVLAFSFFSFEKIIFYQNQYYYKEKQRKKT